MKSNINPFIDGRPIPEIGINCKIIINSTDKNEINNWNILFSDLMKRPKTKSEFITCSIMRNMSIRDVTLDKIKDYLNEHDYNLLKPIEDLFNNRLEIDLKVFILSLLKIPMSVLK